MAGLNMTASTLQQWLPPVTSGQASSSAGSPSLVHTRQALLRYLVATALAHSPQTALFFAERLHAIDPSSEPSAFVLASALVRVSQPLAALHTLKQPVTFTPTPPASSNVNAAAASTSTTPAADCNDDWSAAHAPPPRFNNNNNANNGANYHTIAQLYIKLTKPASQASLRCARLYANCCLQLGKANQGRTALAAVAAPSTLAPLAPADSQIDMALSGTAATGAGVSDVGTSDLASAAIALELARLASAEGERERAIKSYRSVLELQPWCWEAIESLCAQGAPPDPDALFPPRPRPPSHAVPISPLPQHSTTTASNAQAARSQSAAAAAAAAATSYPPPLGPSQTSVVNSAGVVRTRSSHENDGLGFFTPTEPAAPNNNNNKRADIRGPLFPQNPAVRRPTGHKGNDRPDDSIDDSSFEASFYRPVPLSFGQSAASQAPMNGITADAGSLFTPPAVGSLAAGAAPGVKRNRAGTPQNVPQDTRDEDNRRSSAAQEGRGARESAPMPRPMRRSSRLSKDTNPGDSVSRPMALSRSQQGSLSANATGRSTRDKKRSKAGTGPAILSDVSSEVLSPTSHSSSPVPSSPGGLSLAQAAHGLISLSEAAVQDAEEYVVNVLRSFGRAAASAAKFESAKCIEACQALPVEQQKTWRAHVFAAKAHMELLNYGKAEKSYAQARQVAPYLLDSMEMFSTLLWHMRNPTALSCLAQDLMVVAPKSAAAWIAAGNVFSHLEDHTAALKCFKRATQVDRTCVYAVTLSGHECVALEDFTSALNFFREAIRLDERHYNAWFGIGNVYMQTGQFRLAEFHFRKAAEINPSNATLLCCVGTVLEKQQETRNALAWYERACVLAPESPAVRFKRVRILIALKHYELAESDLIALRDRAPNEFNVHYLLGKLYKSLKRPTEMLKHFGLAQDIEPRMASLIREQIENASEQMEVED
ncbi:hypothetical protein ACM66B_004846 [Microbotryomycetes sp. NB124-2]